MGESLTIPAAYESLAELQPFVETAAENALPSVQSLILLAIHELCTNIIRHAYAGSPGDITIEVMRDAGWLQFIVRDSADREYIPGTGVEAPDPLTLPEGGWGIFILHQVMTHVEYRRLLNGNEWVLRKNMLDI